METEEEDGEKTKVPQKRRRKRRRSSVAGPVFLANEESHHRDGEGEGEEEEAHLSDLDNEVEEYILTEKEVSS